MNKFREFGLDSGLIRSLDRLRIKDPTDIQLEAIPAILNRKDIIAESKTGTGKTLAFLLPIFNMMKKESNNIQTLIISPTRELAIQIGKEAEKLDTDFNILAVYGGKDINAQLNKIDKNPDIVIATPGRLIDHIKRKTIDLTKVKYFVIDEVDQILLMGFRDDVDFIASELSKNRQNLFFSATINAQLKKMAYRVCNNPQEITMRDNGKVLENISLYIAKTRMNRKYDLLCELINRDAPFLAIVFCRTKRRVDELEKELYNRGYNCNKLHSDITQSKREKIMKSFHNLEIQILIATDVASRGIDVKGVTHIYNYDIPEKTDTAIHRMGRTARAGEAGKAYFIVTEQDGEFVESAKKNFKAKELDIDFGKDIKALDILPKAKYNKRVHVKSKKTKFTK